MTSGWSALPYDEWRATRDTLHAHTQVLGKLAAALAPPEPQLQHAALRLTARGWETNPLPAPDGSGASASRSTCIAAKPSSSTVTGGRSASRSTPDRACGRGERARCSPRCAPWGVGGDRSDPAGDAVEDAARRGHEHATFDPARVQAYFAAATHAAQVLAALRAPYRGGRLP